MESLPVITLENKKIIPIIGLSGDVPKLVRDGSAKAPFLSSSLSVASKKADDFHPSFRFKVLHKKKESSASGGTFLVCGEEDYFLPLRASIVTWTVFSPSTLTSFSAARPLLHSARTMWSPASRLWTVSGAPSVLSALSPSI